MRSDIYIICIQRLIDIKIASVTLNTTFCVHTILKKTRKIGYPIPHIITRQITCFLKLEQGILRLKRCRSYKAYIIHTYKNDQRDALTRFSHVRLSFRLSVVLSVYTSFSLRQAVRLSDLPISEHYRMCIGPRQRNFRNNCSDRIIMAYICHIN